jgi:hypothetical protein
MGSSGGAGLEQALNTRTAATSVSAVEKGMLGMLDRLCRKSWTMVIDFNDQLVINLILLLRGQAQFKWVKLSMPLKSASA